MENSPVLARAKFIDESEHFRKILVSRRLEDLHQTFVPAPNFQLFIALRLIKILNIHSIFVTFHYSKYRSIKMHEKNLFTFLYNLNFAE